MIGKILLQAAATVNGDWELIQLRDAGGKFVVSTIIGNLEVSRDFASRKKAEALYERMTADLRRRVLR
mgnify:CR=1 FL=1